MSWFFTKLFGHSDLSLVVVLWRRQHFFLISWEDNDFGSCGEKMHFSERSLNLSMSTWIENWSPGKTFFYCRTFLAFKVQQNGFPCWSLRKYSWRFFNIWTHINSIIFGIIITLTSFLTFYWIKIFLQSKRNEA